MHARLLQEADGPREGEVAHDTHMHSDVRVAVIIESRGKEGRNDFPGLNFLFPQSSARIRLKLGKWQRKTHRSNN